ncbi:MAG: hypothetical protein L6Q92_15500, partial [Phycisphaerae bacterium]|nr:hypothetical protein [Phycisphaerae bacterium]
MVALARRSAFAFSMTAAVWLAGLAAAQPASAQDVLLHRQLPNRRFGFTSDTAVINNLGLPDAMISGDRFSLGSSAQVFRLKAWGFYGGQFDEQIEPPPTSETIRVRFYADQSGLPGTMLYQELFLNPSREATGYEIAQGPLPPEYLFTVDLATPFTAVPGVDYWISIVQLDDIASHFRWESSNGGEFAIRYPIDTPWRILSPGQLAYELWTPEPSTALLFITAMVA